jgi:Ca-activated chloride channel family protein
MKRVLIIIFFLIISFQSIPVNAQLKESSGENDASSPYFLVQGDADVESFPLLETKADVKIAGVIAEIELTQVYKNDGKKTIEAVYVFPLGVKSAIHAMRMQIGERIIDAEIEETEKARQIYEDAKDSGKVASLLEQKRPNVFQMKVANIMPGDEVKVIVKYTEILVPEKGIYEYVFPTVVGPRFTGEQKNKEDWTATPYLHEKENPPYKFDIKVNLRTGIPLSNISVPIHDVDIDKEENEATITLSKKDKYGGNRDFILRYSLVGNKIETGLLLYPGKEENFFLLMLEPPEKVRIDMVPPREYLFVVDVSGSMYGFPLDVSKALIKDIIEGLREKDYFNILFFAGGSAVLSPEPLSATKANKKKAIEMVMSQTGGGGTRLLDALNRISTLPKKEGLSRIIVAATDGYISVEKEAFDHIRENLGENNFFAFGIGSSVNRYLIEGMARAGKGEPFIVTNQNEAGENADKFLDYIQSPLLTDIKTSFDGFDAYDVEPIAMPDLFAERPLVLFGKYRKASGSITVRGQTAKGDFKKVIKVKSSMEDEDNSAVKYLWAREKIATLDDYGKVGTDVKDEVIKLGLEYHLMTQYTSFVAVDKIIRKTGEVVTVKQPLPLPQGVSDYAVGGYGASPVPGMGGMLESKAPMKAAEYMSAPKTETDKISEKGEKTYLNFYISKATLGPKTDLKKLESFLSDELEVSFEVILKNWNLKTLTILIEVENGAVKKVTIKDYKTYQGKACEECIEKSVKRELDNLNLPSDLKGSLELTVNYI